MAKTKRLKTVRAGRLVYAVCYTQARPSDAPRIRQVKAKCSSEARKRINFRVAWQKLELLLAANYTGADIVLTLTYDNIHLPVDKRAAVKLVTKFLRQLRRRRRAQGQELKYIYVTEGLHGEHRLHHHLVINSADEDASELLALWRRGSVEIDYVDPERYSELARYLTKEPREYGNSNGARSWTPSQNLNKPDSSTALVDDSYNLLIPAGAHAIESACLKQENGFGSYAYIKYLLPDITS